MTQEVQPLTWQKRTNIEEHQQFFSKINEIIDNLAPTVDEAEAAIAQATAAIASANDAIATANAASAAASAAASQAQTAVTTVAGYNTRLTAAEGDIDALDGNAVKKTGESSQSIAGDISVSGAISAGGNATVGGNLGVTGQSVLSGNVSMPGGCSLGGNPTAPDVAAGVYGTFIANANKVKNELDAYAPMVRTTGNQTKAGQLTLTSYPIIKMGNVCRLVFNNTESTIGTIPDTVEQWGVYFGDKNNASIGGIRMTRNPSGKIEFSFRVYKTDGSFQQDYSIWSTNQDVVP